MRDFVQNIQLFHRNFIDFVKNVKTWDVDSISLNDINEVVDIAVIIEIDVSTDELVLSGNELDGFVTNAECLGILDNSESTLLYIFDFDSWLLFV